MIWIIQPCFASAPPRVAHLIVRWTQVAAAPSTVVLDDRAR
jgi:hypothetical protein